MNRSSKYTDVFNIANQAVMEIGVGIENLRRAIQRDWDRATTEHHAYTAARNMRHLMVVTMDNQMEPPE